MFSSNASQVSAVTQAEAIDFDGTNDYLSRASDLTGNTDGKTFTLSFWVWPPTVSGTRWQVVCNTGVFPQQFSFSIVNNSGQFRGYDTSGNVVLQGSFISGWEQQTWNHVLVSFNLASTSQRWAYVNDIDVGGSFNAYVNTNIDFTNGGWYVGSNSASTDIYQGRLSNVYLDKTYRDLSITANRRLFVTADLKPAAGQAALNPIIYLTMSDPSSPGLNTGTGGNFTLTGTVARSGRGPNQYNAPYSDLDGSADYLERTSVTGMADASTFTFACSFILDVTTNSYIAQCGGNEFAVRVQSGQLRLLCYATGSVLLVNATVDITGGFVVGRNYVVTISLNTTNGSQRHVYVNGQAATVTWSTYTSGLIQFAQTWRIGRAATTPYFNGRLGALWFNTSYIDLSVAANLAKFVTATGIDAKPVDLGATGELPTGTSPLIYLPMYGNNAGKNYGTGGDFTVNSGPYTGARGPNEFWGNKADFDGTTGYLSRTSALTGVSDSTTLSLSFWVKPDVTAASQSFFVMGNSAGNQFYVNFKTLSNGFDAALRTSANGLLAAFSYTGGALSTSVASHICFMVDITNASLRGCYLNGTSVGSFSVYNTGSGSIATASPRVNIAARTDLTPAVDVLDGYLSEFYFTTTYIDFSQEANRLKFRDAFGNPTDLPSAITAATVPTPAVYMRFPPTAFGTNSGTGGDFTVNGTITDGGQL
jgi:hypothetical protein